MAWTAPFIAALTQPATAIRYILQVVAVYNEPRVAPFSIASHAGLGADLVAIGSSVPGGMRVHVEGAQLNPRGWTSTIGMVSVGIVTGINTISAHMTRGTIVALKAGFIGMAAADFETIAVGQVRNLRGVAPMWTMEIHDLLQATRQRLETSYVLTELFAGWGNSTTVASAYTPGDVTLQVASTTGQERQTGGTGAVRVTTAAGATFILTYTGLNTGPIRFTGVSAAGVAATTAVAAAVADVVREVAWLYGHPIDIVRKILCTRDGTNGTYDVLPSGWGLGISDSLVDHADATAFRDNVVIAASGSYLWEYPQEALAEDAYTWLVAFLAGSGLFITARQGCITVRAGQNTAAGLYVSALSITDTDIEAVEEYEAWDYTHDPEYAYVESNTTTGGVTVTRLSGVDNAATLPTRRTASLSVTDRVFNNGTAIGDDMVARLAQSLKQVPERIVVRCAGRRLAQLAPGDIVPFSCTRTSSRRDGATGWAARKALVYKVSPDWDGGKVRVGMFIYPESEAQFG